MPRSSLRKSPERISKEENNLFEEDDHVSPPRIMSKSISHRESMKHFRENSPYYPRQRSPSKFTQLYDLDVSEVKKSQYDSPDTNLEGWKNNEEKSQLNYIPMYTADPLLLKQYETNQIKLKEELAKTKEKHEGAIRGKNEEIKRLQKQLDNMRALNNELQERLENYEENERKLASVKAERDILDRKIHSIEAECDNYRRQFEYAKENAESYKIQIDEYERSSRSRTQDIERELRTSKDRSDEIERQLQREKERNQDLERKITKSTDRGFNLQNELTRAEERIKRLERDLQEAKDRSSHETSQQLRETEILRRKIEDLTQEILRKERKDLQEGNRKEFYESAKEFSDNYVEPRRENNEHRREHNERYSLPRRGDSEFNREDTKRNNQDIFLFSDKRNDPITWRKNEAQSPRNRQPENVKGLEGKLMNLQMDQKRLVDELAKIPPQGRRIAQIKRKEEIDLELEILNSNISTIKNKLRQLNAL